jgi:hypothetical protein
MKPRTTIVYIDGYNLFHALKEQKWKKYYWLDLWKFGKGILFPEQVLSQVKYFTSRVNHDPHEQIRQNSYIEALETLHDVDIQYGNFMSDRWECEICHKWSPVHNEKQTDVNIAISLIGDAQDGNFKDAFLITADSDQVGTIRYVREHYPDLRIIAAFPPKRSSNELKSATPLTYHLREKHFVACQFPDQIKSQKGFILTRPMSWQ